MQIRLPNMAGSVSDNEVGNVEERIRRAVGQKHGIHALRGGTSLLVKIAGGQPSFLEMIRSAGIEAELCESAAANL
jgi:hypothetical protein